MVKTLRELVEETEFLVCPLTKEKITKYLCECCKKYIDGKCTYGGKKL